MKGDYYRYLSEVASGDTKKGKWQFIPWFSLNNLYAAAGNKVDKAVDTKSAGCQSLQYII